jgi:hypothetical protein
VLLNVLLVLKRIGAEAHQVLRLLPRLLLNVLLNVLKRIAAETLRIASSSSSVHPGSPALRRGKMVARPLCAYCMLRVPG